MANYDNQPRYGATVARGADSAVDAGLRAHMIRVYNYMAIGLVLTGVWRPSAPIRCRSPRSAAGCDARPRSARRCSAAR